MIQRVQSVYLLLVTALMSLFLAGSYAKINLADNEFIRFHAFALQRYLESVNTEMVRKTWPLGIMVLLTGAVSFLNIFLFRKRMQQMRLCLLALLMLVTQLGLIYLYYRGAKGNFGTGMPSFSLPAVFPLVCIILLVMAYRAILHDETLVRSYDRIR